MHILTKKRALGALATLIVLAVAGVAFAYFTTSGSGQGSAQVGKDTALTINATINPGIGGIVPSGSPAVVSFTATNAGTGHEYVTNVQYTGIKAYKDAGHTEAIAVGTGPTECDTSKFSMVEVIEKTDVAGSATTSLPNSGNLVYANDASHNQGGCMNAYLVASFESN
jgi:hypothetical protein